jgi:hypothetical protein
VVPQLFRATVTQIAQFHEPRLQSRPRFLRCFPDFAAFLEVRAAIELVVDVVRRNRLSIELELEAVQDGSLLRLGFDTRGNERRIGQGTFRCVQEKLVELTHRQLVELGTVREKLARFTNQRTIAIKRGRGFRGSLGARVMNRRHIRDCKPLGLIVYPVKSLVSRVRECEETIGALLDRRRRGRHSQRGAEGQERDRLF